MLPKGLPSVRAQLLRRAPWTRQRLQARPASARTELALEQARDARSRCESRDVDSVYVPLQAAANVKPGGLGAAAVMGARARVGKRGEDAGLGLTLLQACRLWSSTDARGKSDVAWMHGVSVQYAGDIEAGSVGEFPGGEWEGKLLVWERATSTGWGSDFSRLRARTPGSLSPPLSPSLSLVSLSACLHEYPQHTHTGRDSDRKVILVRRARHASSLGARASRCGSAGVVAVQTLDAWAKRQRLRGVAEPLASLIVVTATLPPSHVPPAPGTFEQIAAGEAGQGDEDEDEREPETELGSLLEVAGRLAMARKSGGENGTCKRRKRAMIEASQCLEWFPALSAEEIRAAAGMPHLWICTHPLCGQVCVACGCMHACMRSSVRIDV